MNRGPPLPPYSNNVNNPMRQLNNDSFIMNPYKILGIDESYDIKQVRWVYRQLSLKHHPDKGGDPTYFGIITKAYHFVIHQIQKDQVNKEKITKPVRKEKYNTEVILEDEFGEKVAIKEMQNSQLDPNAKNFDKTKFNKIFEQVKIRDQNDQKGYSDAEFEPEETNYNNLSLNNFNERFNQHKKKYNKDVVVYKEPEPLYFPTKHSGFYELGVDNIEDFSSDKYVDYKKAYSKDNKFIDPDTAYQSRQKYSSIEQLKSARENIVPLTQEELREKALRQERQLEIEKQRLDRQKQFDMDIAKNYKKINKRLIKNK